VGGTAAQEVILIAFYRSLFTRLFGEEPEEEKNNSAEQTSQQEQAPEPEPEPPPPPRDLLFPSTHAIHQLWNIRSRQAGWLPEPALSLEEQPDLPALLSDDEAQRELRRLQTVVNSTASERLRLIQIKQQAAPKAATVLAAAGSEPRAEPPLPDMDAQVVVFTAASGLVAWVLVYPPVGQGAELDREILDQALKKAKVCYGVDDDLLNALPQTPSRYFHMFPCARGEPAVHGVDGKVVDYFPRVVERKLTVDENNRVDYASLNVIHNVKEGEVICELVPPTEGEAGRSVQNEPIPARDGKKIALPKGRRTEISEDGLSLVAAADGHVEFSGRAFQVKPLLDIPGNVDYSTGNINFLGDVCVHGDICSGFTVRAIGNITVGGVVEACTLEAGGDVVVAGGVQGDNQGVIRAQRGIFAKFIENACVYAKESICSDCLINCDVYCDGTVEVRSGRMTVIGGLLRAAQEVSAGIIGSRAECRTEIFVGGQPCGEFERHILLQEIEELEKDLEKTERQPDSPIKLSRMGKMRMQLMVNKKKLDQINKDWDLLSGEDGGEPVVHRLTCDTVYPGTVLAIDNCMPYEFFSRVNQCNATLEDGEIHFQ